MPVWLLITLVIIGVGLSLVLALAARKPRGFVITRSAFIGAPREAIYPRIADLRLMNEWNPFAKEPSVEIAYAAQTSGVGAFNTWDNAKHNNVGRIEITGATPPSQVVMRLDMEKPMAASNRIVFDLASEGQGTRVSWTMSGDMNFSGCMLSVFVSIDNMCGKEFVKGLTALKQQVEDGAPALRAAE